MSAWTKSREPNSQPREVRVLHKAEPFYTAYHVARLRPREPMTREELLFYCACIKANRFRYSYGRQANRTIASIKVPALGSVPPWVHGSLARVVSAAGLEATAAKNE